MHFEIPVEIPVEIPFELSLEIHFELPIELPLEIRLEIHCEILHRIKTHPQPPYQASAWSYRCTFICAGVHYFLSLVMFCQDGKQVFSLCIVEEDS